jgi:hypothetical protein
MPYFVTDEQGRSTTLAVRVEPAEDYKAYYANGAQGGFLAFYHYRIDFYQDVVPPVKYLDPDGTGRIPQEAVAEGVLRKIVCSVHLPVPFAKELLQWLQKNVNEFETEFGEIRLPGSNVALPEAKQDTHGDKTPTRSK